MAFVNEYIPAEDFKKYKLAEIDAQFLVGGTKRGDWTIDRERNIYLRQVASGREEMSGISKWSFFWKGTLLMFQKEVIQARATRNGPSSVHLRVSKLSIPSNIEQQRQEIYQDLRDAFMAYRDGGVFDTSTEYSMQLDIEA